MNAGLVAARIGAALVLVAAAAAVLWPFLTAMAWAAILAYLTWPLFRRLRQRARRPALAAGAFTAGVGLLIAIPVALLLVALAEQAPALFQAVRDWAQQESLLPAWIADSALVQRMRDLLRLTPLGDPARAGEWIGWAGGQVSRRLVSIAGGVARNAFAFAAMLVSLYAFYLNGERIAGVGNRLAPLLFPRAPERFLERIGESVQAVMFGLIGTALVQGTLAGLGIAVAGVPNAVALGAATVVISVLPGGGSALTLASAIWLGFQARFAAAVALGLWGLFVVGSVDNVLRPLLIGGRSRIPFLLVFFGVIGGLASFGLIGLFLGPVLLSVTLTLVTEFVRTPELTTAGDSKLEGGPEEEPASQPASNASPPA